MTIDSLMPVPMDQMQVLFCHDQSYGVMLQGADIKRVWTMRNSLQNLDMGNESSDSMKSLLEQALMSPIYLKHEEVSLIL